MKNKKSYYLSVLILCLVLPLAAQKDVSFELEKVAGNIYCLYGPGGNMGVLQSEEGLLIVDSKFDYTAEETLKQIKSISPSATQILVLTHYHWDHTSGFKTIGENALIISHKNCKASLVKRSKQEDQEFISRIKTYDREERLGVGGERIKLLHLKPAHTAGDTIVIFETSKVIHTGDLFFHDIPPYIDVKDGANTLNWIGIIESLCKQYPDYKLIPGHGKVTDTRSFLQFAEYLKYLRQEVIKAMNAGKTAKEAMDEIKFDRFPNMKNSGTFATKENNILWVYQEILQKKK